MEKIKKPTKKETLLKIREVVIDNEEYVSFIDHEIELLDKKNSKNGTSKTQVENEKVKIMLVEELTKLGKPVTITELMSESEVVANYVLENGAKLSNQKISALFTQMKDTQIVRITDKKKTYFSVV